MTVESLLARQTKARETIRDKVMASIRRQWDGLGSWNDADVARFTRVVVPLVRAGQLQTAAATDVYIASLLTELTSEHVAPLGISSANVTDLRPVPADEVYRRPFVDVWSGLKDGKRYTDALTLGAERLLRLADDDLSLAHRAAAASSLHARGIHEYRRVTRPEMSRSGSCPLCAIAAEHVYKTDRLMPIHTRCSCAVMPVLGAGAGDPGARLNAEDDHQVPDGVDIAVHEHGELGPVLAIAGQSFDTAA